MLSSLWNPPAKMPGGPPTNDTTDPPAPLVSSWQARADAGEPVAVVRVRNLQASIPVGRDAWGRAGLAQPILLSSEVSFARPFSGNADAGDERVSASGDTDLLDAGTVHYGSLSKTLLAGLEVLRLGGKPGSVGTKVVGGVGEGGAPRTADVLELLWVRMTGRVVDGSSVALPLDQVPFLDAATLRSLVLTIGLPKASLLGAGVSLTVTAGFRGEFAGKGEEKEKVASKNPLQSYSRCLRIQGLHVPTLIGVNPNEREAKQMVVADVEIDRYDVVEDVHSDLEKIIVETIETSSFKTLEALASHVANRILSDFRIGDNPAPMKERGWKVKVCLEKPIAVPFAECPSVEVTMG
ncbi:Dihydroneopterin aldolase-domain-containing protein [Annulohypoxylon maeteangense]|uniref:Dihydroneopterin aldolase-domain-containing protein n=1 Tax=Annulohypoxylon maeteangense TaxID=1927788 RepID=UPI0020080804|nr:Dihydroneopterin aldolase-domain-containing protein [Annulohypoxylon maeteangense]KAI0890517.1 Dihydroneopterin aldolase-domain-containing protein [Annulohypoxylon maeteangense]